MDGLDAPVCVEPIDALKLSPIPYFDVRRINAKREFLQIYEQREIFPFQYTYRFKLHVSIKLLYHKLILGIITDYCNYDVQVNKSYEFLPYSRFLYTIVCI